MRPVLSIPLSVVLLLGSMLLWGAEPPERLPQHSPADAVAEALADLKNQDPANPIRVPPELWQYTRYLDLGDMPIKERESAVRVLSGHVNALSVESDIMPLVRVNPTLLRLNVRDYGKDWGAVFEKLKDVDVYFHVKLKKVVEEVRLKDKPWEGGKWTDGKDYPPGAFRYSDGGPGELKRVEKVVTAAAPWLPTDAITELIELTQSQTPVVNGAWFFQQTAIQFLRVPGYYDFLGVKDQATFEKLVGFNEKESRGFANLWREAVSRSGVIVGKRPRRIERLSSLGGGLWRSLDSKVTKDKANPLRVLDDALEFEATEQLAPGPNGMMIWGLFNNKGVRQDTAPDNIAADLEGAANDGRVHINLNCVRCHAIAGIKEFPAWARTLFQPPRSLESPDYDKLKELRQQYLRHLEPHVENDRRVYARAIAESSGLAPEKWSRGYYDLWTYYIEAKVDIAWAARSLGTTPAQFQAALAHVKKTTGTIDPVLATFLAPEAQPIGVESWEEAYPLAQTYLRGLSP